MKDISIYFTPKKEITDKIEEKLNSKIICYTENNFPKLKKNSIVIFECPENRNNNQYNVQTKEIKISANPLDDLYNLYLGENWNFDIYDLGYLLPGENISDTYFALSQIVTELVKHKVTPIIIGGSQDLTFPVYKGFQHLEQMVNLAVIDSKFDLGAPDDQINNDAFITQILLSRPCYLFNCSNIGIQSPYIKKSELDLFEKLYFDVCRLGEINSNFKITEPYIRNADIISLDLNAIKYADFQTEFNTPNGLTSEQICQIAKYSGISDKLSVFGLFNLNKQFNSPLLAEIIWYFIDGFAQRKGDFPIGSKKDYLKFIVNLDASDHELIFYKSPKSSRWWLEVPYPSQNSIKYERHHLIPCNYEDYLEAMKNEIPDLWWKTYQKLS
jgi:formiminoglutamase